MVEHISPTTMKVKNKSETKKEIGENRTEINSFLYEQQRKEIDSLLEQKEKKKPPKLKRKPSRLKRIILITIVYLLFAIPIYYFIIIQSENQLHLLTWLFLGYIGVLILIYFLVEWIRFNHTKKGEPSKK